MSGDKDWVKAAMTDDIMVVELLVRLNRSHPTPPKKPVKKVGLPLEWTVRQRRSAALNNPNKPATRASPTTPLSWSGDTSLSGGRGGSNDTGFEESSRSPPPPPSSKVSHLKRSKVNDNREKLTTKRSRKKKTLTELKEEENLLLKERRDLKREISAFRVKLEQQRATNESLKRIKLELQPPSQKGIATVPEAAISDQVQQTMSSSHPIPPITPPTVGGDIVTPQSPTSNTSPQQKEVAAPEDKFVLPDLNIAFEEESSSAVIVGLAS